MIFYEHVRSYKVNYRYYSLSPLVTRLWMAEPQQGWVGQSL